LSKLEEVEAILKAATAAPIEATNEKELDDEHPPTDPPDEDEDTNGGSPDEPEGEDNGEDGEGDTTDYQTVKEIADRLGTSAKALYENIRIPMQDGDPVSLGELKDMVITGRNERALYEESSADLIGQRRNMETIAEILTPEQRQTANDIITHNQQRELRLLEAVLPTWKDETVAKSEQKRIIELTAKYGLSKPELEALITDHRLVKLLRDVAIRPASAPVHSHGTVSPRKSSTNGDASYRRGIAPGASKADKLSAINALLK
jgi:hypothetical protein